MRKRITVKLALGFIAIVLAMILVVGFLFRGFFVNRTIEENEKDLFTRADNISDSIIAGKFAGPQVFWAGPCRSRDPYSKKIASSAAFVC